MLILFEVVEVNDKDRYAYINTSSSEEEILEEIAYAIDEDGIHPSNLIVYNLENNVFCPIVGQYAIMDSPNNDGDGQSNVIDFKKAVGN